MKRAASFVCQSCGASRVRWAGRCDACGSWNSLVEEVRPVVAPKGLDTVRGGRPLTFFGLNSPCEGPARLLTGIGELDRVCGKGLVAGSALLVGGDPGIGKSTLLLQACAALSGLAEECIRARAIYISGEEAVDQVRLRAVRLGLAQTRVELAAATSVRDILCTLDAAQPLIPVVLVIDSIQTMFVDTLDSAPGTVAQVRAAGHELIRLAKRSGLVSFLVSHVTKEGMIAGPRVLEHMVDTVLYFEGERGHPFRILRAVKNRFGPTNEIGVFEMTDEGLVEVTNPSALFLAERRGNMSGSCVFAGIEGTRPMLVEIQALVGQTGLSTPRRAVVGWDGNRLAMVLAVLDVRCGLTLGARDIYLNVAGGLRITEPAADLAVAAALVSAATDVPVTADMVVFGEIGLSGEVRSVAQGETRLKEAAKLGFTQAMIPQRFHSRERHRQASWEGAPFTRIHEVGNLQMLVDSFQQIVRT
ncbi:DNA repair protein RadA [invertebrate metagenome]|uniref:DNA repair protein RadA n=1 Tax=invertebrate metagenome TaxID=1711999 RepID=A0A484H6E9_9ZZZZ